MKSAVVTGIGLKTPLGPDTESAWRGLLSGASGLEPFWAGTIGAPVGRVRGVEEAAGAGPRSLSLALAVSKEAFSNAGLEARDAACVAGIGKPDLGRWGALDPASTLASYLEGDLSMLISNRLGLTGPAMAVSAACATGAVAIGLASGWIRDGRCKTALVVCSDAPIHPLYIAGFRQLGVLAPLDGPDCRTVRPFDRRRAGFGLGEGAAALILEEEGAAAGRGARPLARVSGFSQAGIGTHPIRFDAGGSSIARVLERTLRRAGRRPTEVDYLNCHGTATALNDTLETRAIKKAFGKAASGVSFSSTKASTGHMLAATGAVEAAFAVLALRDGRIPPTLNLEEPDPDCDLDFTPLAARPRNVRHAMSLSFGFGGAVGALCFSRC